MYESVYLSVKKKSPVASKEDIKLNLLYHHLKAS